MENKIYIRIFQPEQAERFTLALLGLSEVANQHLLNVFMELLVLPEIKDENERKRTMDELPQSGTGKMVMTTEPKFIPKEAAELPMEI